MVCGAKKNKESEKRHFRPAFEICKNTVMVATDELYLVEGDSCYRPGGRGQRVEVVDSSVDETVGQSCGAGLEALVAF